MKKNTTDKTTLRAMVGRADAAKKVNPLDLSADQDLTIALMNLISIEEHFVFSGAKTQKTGFYDLISVIHDMRTDLMKRVVPGGSDDSNGRWGLSRYLLAASMRVMEVGTKALGAGKKQEAYDLFNQAYDLYSLFWGINMGLIDMAGVQQIVPDINLGASNIQPATGTNTPDIAQKHDKSIMRRLGGWVKEKVNCCIE